MGTTDIKGRQGKKRKHKQTSIPRMPLELRLRITRMALAGLAHAPEDPHTELPKEAV